MKNGYTVQIAIVISKVQCVLNYTNKLQKVEFQPASRTTDVKRAIRQSIKRCIRKVTCVGKYTARRVMITLTMITRVTCYQYILRKKPKQV